jgi:hypothetical protein
MCDVACHLDADCGSLGGNFTCLSGQCRERVANEPVTEAEVPAAIGVVTGSDASTKDSGATLNDSGATLNDSGANADGGASSDAFVADEVLCDGSDTMRLSLQSGAGGWVPSTTLWFATPYGDQVLLVDGQCRYYATGGDPLLGMRTGVLTTAQASELANAIGWSKLASWSTLFADAGPSCEDASGSVIRRPGVAARSCVCGCDPNLTPELSAAIAQVGPWTDRLVSAGEALTGPVTALAVRVPMPANDEFAWPLGRHIMAIPDLESGKAAVPYDQGARFELADEVAALRDLRARQRARADPKITDYIPVSDMGASYHVAVRDELPDAAQRAFDVLVGSVTR